MIVRGTTVKTRLRAELKGVDARLRRQRHAPLNRQGEWLGRVVRGDLAGHANPGNIASLPASREKAVRHWRRALRRRGQIGPHELGAQPRVDRLRQPGTQD